MAKEVLESDFDINGEFFVSFIIFTAYTLQPITCAMAEVVGEVRNRVDLKVNT